MEVEESLLKLEELRKSSNNDTIKHKIVKIQEKILIEIADSHHLKLD